MTNNIPTANTYPIKYRGNKISLEKARVLIRLKRGIVFPRNISTEEEIKKTQEIVNTLKPEEQDTYYYKKNRNALYSVSYFNGLETFVPEYKVEEYSGIYKVYRTHECGYWEYRAAFHNKAELDKYLNNR